ncbi:MHYT domain-containing protein [Streptomyces spongiicola]|uniref:MHYT domain-containing protein n=1 Tax=Streptomyces spongiicola TaxID=1690221 RepID=UPI00142D6584|nr:MHYT domain-containing protein [Streptomyces spongiicola]
MRGTVDGFSHGLVTPVAAYVMACLGGVLGLRCTIRALRGGGGVRPGWPALGAVSIGSGIWTMHHVAMSGFAVEEVAVGHDPVITFAGLGVAVAMAAIGILVVGQGGASAMAVVTGGMITGLGIATVHYLGMAGVRLSGRIEYDTPTVALSVVIAVVAATAALWAAVSVRGFLPGVGAGLLMGVAVSGMHYTGMAAVTVHVDAAPVPPAGDGTPATLLAPMLVGSVVFAVLAAVIVVSDRALLVSAPGTRHHPAPGRAAAAGVPAQRRPSHGGGPADRTVPARGARRASAGPDGPPSRL